MMPPKSKSGTRILQNSSWILGGKSVGAVLSLIYLALVARALGPEQFGTFSLIFSFAQLITGLVAFQTWQIIVRYGTAHVLGGANDKLAQLVWICLALDGLGLVVGMALALAGSYGMGIYFNWDDMLLDTAMVFSAIFMLSARATPNGILRVHDRFRDAALSDSLVPVIRFVGVLLALLWEPTLEVFLIVWAVSEIGTTMVMWVIILRTLDLPLMSSNPLHIIRYIREYPDLPRFAGWSNLGSSLKLAGQQAVVLAVGFFAGEAAAGFFRLGHQLGQVLARVADALSYSVFTEYNRMNHEAGSAAAASMIGRILKVTGVSAAIIFAILFTIGKWLIITIFGAEFVPAFPFVLLLGGAAAVQVGATALEPALLFQGLAGRVLIANLLGAMLLGALCIWLMPQYEAFGAAIAVLGGTVVNAVCLGWLYKRTMVGKS